MATTLPGRNNLSFIGILAFAGFLSFMSQPSAYTWGEQDMMPFLERLADPTFLENDFFTNASVEKSPRMVFTYVIHGISYLTGLSWYQTLYIGKLLLLMGLPVLFYLVLMALLEKYVSRVKLNKLAWILVMGIALVVVSEDISFVFSIAGLATYKPVLIANNVSLLFCFIGVLLKERQYNPLFYLTFFFLGCLLHPVMGLFTIAFYFSFLIPKFKTEKVNLLSIGLTALSAILIIRFLFAPSSELSTAEFIEYYVLERHPWHYHVPDFSHWLGNWQLFFGLMILLMAIPLVYGLTRKKRELSILAAISLFAYIAAIGIQYLFIDVFPVKFMAYLGVTRYTIFAYWSLLILWVLMISHMVTEKPGTTFPGLSVKGLSFVLINLFIIGLIYMDDPRDIYSSKWDDFYSFVETTPGKSIFLTYSDHLNTDMRIKGRRGVFISREFPFAESKIKEFTIRNRMVFGSRLDDTSAEAFFRKLGPEDFAKVASSYPLDYVIVEAPFAQKFQQFTPVWSNSNLKVYSVKDFN